MKYLLFDLAVLASTITIAHKSLGLLSGWNSPFLQSESAKPFECHSTYSHACDDRTTNTNASISSHDHQHQRQQRQLQQQQPEDLKIGDLVEVYNPKIDQDHAFFGEIIRVKTSIDGSIKYDIVSGPNRDSLYEDIDEICIQLHKPSDYKRHAMCYNQGATPCLILSYSDDNRQYYHILTITDGLLHQGTFPITRVRPIVYESPDFHEEFKRLSSTTPIVHTRSNDDGLIKIELTGAAEIYDDSSSEYAAPLVITDYNEDGSINLKDTFSGTKYSGIDEDSIQPYLVYQDGTPALCKVGTSRNLNMNPCTIVSHSITDTDSVSYTVSYIKGEKAMQTDLSFINVRRFLKLDSSLADEIGVLKRN